MSTRINSSTQTGQPVVRGLMAADPLIYCLEHLTDYDQFERLCHDVMALQGYRNIEPLGGFQDKGRDAIHRDASGDETATVFAYSVRDDWRSKLGEDCAKVKKHGHTCQRFVFVCTSIISSSERDAAVAFVEKTYGWSLELYGMERLATLLRSTHQQVVAQHPQIFCPPFFPVAGGLSISPALDHIVVDHLDADTALAHWLTRRLTLLGYNVWCRGLAPVAGASLVETIRTLVNTRAFRYVCILSAHSIANPDFIARRNIAMAAASQRQQSILIPALAGPIDTSTLDHETRRLEFARFDDAWATGLKQVAAVLSAANCPKRPSGGHELALRSYFPSEIVLHEPEAIASNLFLIKRTPEVVLRFASGKPIRDDAGSVAGHWGFRRLSDQEFLSFHRPPADVAREFSIRDNGGTVWSRETNIDGIQTDNLVKELVRKALNAECRRRGLLYCDERKQLYFPVGLLKNENLKYKRISGESSFFAVTGERSYGRADRGKKYRYHLAPVFVPRGDPQNGYDIIVRVRVRITDLDGALLPGHATNARRKKLCKSWWNEEWLSRTIGVMQFLSNDEGSVGIGSQSTDRLVVDCSPRMWQAPIRLNEEALHDADPTTEAEEFPSWTDDEDEDDADAGVPTK
jgi:hypothetical protein